ncbi:MAG: hypothetical protein FJ387_16785 [Verrucomicrobia bacterium]|nr:hypothetical protein [Verrucomicrobiota bacterium]
MAVLLAGCSSPPRGGDWVIGPEYRPSNVLCRTPYLSRELRRVAVLPMTVGRDDAQLEAGRAVLEPILWQELSKQKRFELCAVSGAQLQLWTGKRAWSADEPLPADLLGRLRTELGCDAVLFSRLTNYRAYPPLIVGWHFQLVDEQQPPVIWAVDEVLDAGESAVANGARRYYQRHLQDNRPLADSHGVLSSPRRFGQYAASTLFATLPGR